MTERGDRLRVGVPISAPGAELQGARQRAKRRRASRVRRRPGGERLAVYEDELEVLAACGLHLFRVRVVPMRERLQERAGRGRGQRVGGTGGVRRGGLMTDRIMLTNSYSVWGGNVLGSSLRRSFGRRMRWLEARVPDRLPASREKSEFFGGASGPASPAAKRGGLLTLNLCCCRLSESSNAASSMSS